MKQLYMRIENYKKEQLNPMGSLITSTGLISRNILINPILGKGPPGRMGNSGEEQGFCSDHRLLLLQSCMLQELKLKNELQIINKPKFNYSPNTKF